MKSDLFRAARLQRPAGPVDVVLDTDTFNEIDDQFALSYLVRSDDELRLRAVYAAPFLNGRVATPREGMERSYAEAEKVLSLLGRDDLHPLLHRGSGGFLPDESTPVPSEAAEHLAALAMEYTPQRPLYVIAIAAITDVASALLLRPEIAERIVVVWLGGHALEWPDNREFNCRQDVAAARVVLGSGAAVVLLPCKGVVSAFATTRYELEHWLLGKNALCDYLCSAAVAEAEENRRGRCWSKPIWDVCAVAWLLRGGFMEDKLIPAPVPGYDHLWHSAPDRPAIRYVYHIRRDALMEDLFTKLTRQPRLDAK